MHQQPVDFFKELKLLIKDYLSARLKLLKYDVYEKSAKVSAVLFTSFVIASLSFMMLFFLSISAGFYFGSLLNSNAAGFLIVSMLYILVLAFILIFKQIWIEKLIANKIIDALTNKDVEEFAEEEEKS